MPETRLRWLLDVDLPRVDSDEQGLDILHAEDVERRPGPAGLYEAARLGRVLVTRNQDFRGCWYIPIAHPGIVILEGLPSSGQEVVRNLTHLLFCLYRESPDPDIGGRRYVIQVDRAIFHISSDGTEEEIAAWKQPRVATSNLVS